MSKEGWLEREVSWAVFNPWQRRYFVLRNNELSWHADPASVGERGKGKAIPWDIGKCVLTNREDVENCFMIHLTTDGRTLLVKAESAEEKNRWMEALKPLHNGSSTFDVITRHVCDAVLVDMTAEVHTHPREDRFQGAMLFTDISGFTALSERLRAESGQQGCERLNGIINAFFDQIIKICLGYGGDVVKFAGDAMFVVFRAESDVPGDDLVQLTTCTVRAARCAVDVMTLDGQTVDAGGTQMALRLHCGIGAGQMTGMTVGSTSGADGRFEYVVGGEPLPQITLTDKLAEAGQVLVAPEAWTYVLRGGPDHGLSVDIVESGCALLLGFERPSKARALSATSATSSAGIRQPGASAAASKDRGSSRTLSHRSASLGEGEFAQVTRSKLLRELRESDPEKVERVLNDIVHRFIPASVQQMIEVESTMDPGKRMHTHWAATQRTVTIMFVRLAEAETVVRGEPREQVAPSLSALQRLDLAVCIMQKVLFQFEGAVSRLQIDDKGTVLKAAFGLPPHFHQNDPARAVLAALHIKENLSEEGIGCTIGITTGDIFCGMVGNSDRCEYTTVGAEVNLAARLMMVAGGSDGHSGILCDERTHSRSHENTAGQARFEGPESLVVKKRKEPLIAYRPCRVQSLSRIGSWDSCRSTKMSNPLVGRDSQLQQLRAELLQIIKSSADCNTEITRSVSDYASRLIVVEGDTGIGKTQVLQALAESPEADIVGNNYCLMATAQWWSKDTPLHAFQPIFHKILQTTVAATFGSEDDQRSAVAQAGKATPRDRGGRTPRATRIPIVLARHKTQRHVATTDKALYHDWPTASPGRDTQAHAGRSSEDEEAERRHRHHMSRAVRLLLSNDRARQARSAGIRRQSHLAQRRTTSLRHSSATVSIFSTSSANFSGPARTRPIINSTSSRPATSTGVLRSMSLASPRFHNQLTAARTPRRTGSVTAAHRQDSGDGTSPTSAVAPNIDVLNDFLPVHFDEGPLTMNVKPADKLNTAILYMAQLLRAYVSLGLRDTDVSRPALLLIENGQDLDSASLRLVSALLDMIPHLLVVLATRQWRPQRAASVKSLDKANGSRSKSTDSRRSSRKLSFGSLPQHSFRTSSLAEWLMARANAADIISLEALSEDDVAQIATNYLGVQFIPPALQVALHRKSHGNPYFAEQLLQTWRESGELVIAQGRARFTPTDAGPEESSTAVGSHSSLPVGVQQVIMERVERLSWSQQITLRAASVVDGTFNIEMLKRIHSRLHELGNDDICLDLQQLCELDLLEEVTGQEDAATDALRARRARADELQPRGSVTLVPALPRAISMYEENDRFEGSLYDSTWKFKSATMRQTVYKALSKSQLKAAHWEVARYREETLMKRVERRCRRHSSTARTGSSPLSARVIEEAREALKVMAARPITNLAIQGANVSAVDTDGEQQNCVRIEFRRTGVGALLDHWERQAIMLGVESTEEQEDWRVSILRAQKMSPFGGDVQYAERLKQGWLNRAEGKQGHGRWIREWFALLPGRLLSYKEPPALMLPQLNHYNAFRMSDNLQSLAEHFIQAEDMDNAIKYLNYAGILALENDHISDSVTSFSQATKHEQTRARKRSESGLLVPEPLQPEQRGRLERLKAEAYVSAGPEHPSSAPKALAHVTKSLDLLAHPISQLVQQRQEAAWAFPQLESWFQDWPDSPDVVTPDDQVDIIRGHLLLFELTRLNYSELCCRSTDAYSAAHFALDLSLTHHDPELVATSLAACCVATCAQGWHTASARLAHSACQALTLCAGSRCAALVQLLLADYYVSHCSWTEAAACFEEAMEIFVDLGDHWRAAIAQDGLRWVEHVQINYYHLARESMTPTDCPTSSIIMTQAELPGSRVSGDTYLGAEIAGQADHYAVVEQVYVARHAWSALRACGASSAGRAHLCAELGSLFPAEFIHDLLENQLGLASHGFSGLLALCAAELAAIYAYWLMEDASSFEEPSYSPAGVRQPSSGRRSSPVRHNLPVQVRAKSYRVLVLASGLMDSLIFPTARAVPALVAVSQGWLRFVERWGAGKQRKRRHRRHSLDHSLMSQPPPSPVPRARAQLGETPSTKPLNSSARSLDAEDSQEATPERASVLSSAHTVATKQRRSKRDSARRLSVPNWRADDDVHGGNDPRISPLAFNSERATHDGVTSTTHSSGGVVVELQLPTRIPIPTRRRGVSAGSSASGSDATPVVGNTSRAPPPPSPLPRAGTTTETPERRRESSGNTETSGSGIGSLLPPVHQTVSSVSIHDVQAEDELTEPSALPTTSTVSTSVRHPPLASILSVDDGDTASSSEDEIPSNSSAPAQQAESPLLLRLKSEFGSDDDEAEDEFDAAVVSHVDSQLEPEPEPEPKPEPGLQPEPEPEPSMAPDVPVYSATPTSGKRAQSATAATHEAREALLQQITSAGDHVQRLLMCLFEYRKVFPVCEPSSDLVELQALLQRGACTGGNNGSGSSHGFDLELDIHYAIEIASRAISSAAVHSMPTERQAAMNGAASLLLRSEPTRAWLVAERTIGVNDSAPMARSSPASSLASTPALSVSVTSPFREFP